MSEKKYSTIMSRLDTYYANVVIWSPGRARAYNRAVNFTRLLYLKPLTGVMVANTLHAL